MAGKGNTGALSAEVNPEDPNAMLHARDSGLEQPFVFEKRPLRGNLTIVFENAPE